jgi:hypothetical protein
MSYEEVDERGGKIKCTGVDDAWTWWVQYQVEGGCSASSESSDVHPSGRLGLLVSLIGEKLRTQGLVVVDWTEEKASVADGGLRWWYESESDVAALMAAMDSKRHERGTGGSRAGASVDRAASKWAVGCIARVRAARVSYRTCTE